MHRDLRTAASLAALGAALIWGVSRGGGAPAPATAPTRGLLDLSARLIRYSEWVHISPDGGTLAYQVGAGTPGAGIMFRRSDGAEFEELYVADAPWGLAFAPDGALLTGDGTRILEVPTTGGPPRPIAELDARVFSRISRSPRAAHCGSPPPKA